MAPNPRYCELAARAADTVAANRANDPRSGICHGLSGTGHLMLDCYHAFGHSRWLELAGESARMLERFRIADRAGVYAMHGDEADSPDLMLGYAGPGSFLLRLARPASTPDLVLGRLANLMRKDDRRV